MKRLPALAVILIFGFARCLPGQETAAEKPLRLPFFYQISFENPGTKEEAIDVLDGVPLRYPVDEADVIALLWPAWIDCRARRSVCAPLEARAIRESFAEPEARGSVLERVRTLLGLEWLGEDAEAAYERLLQDIDVLCARWERWSGDIASFRLCNHATVAPYRRGERKIEFDQVHFERQESGGFEITLIPPFFRLGAGIGTFDIQGDEGSPLILDLFNPAAPGTSAEVVAGDLAQMLTVVADLQEKMATGILVERAYEHLLESLLRHEIGARWFAPDAPEPLIHGVARYYLILHETFAKQNFPGLSERLPRFLYVETSSESEAAEEWLARLAELDPFREIPPEYEEAASRMIAWGLLKLAETDSSGAHLFRKLAETDIPVPEDGFVRESFVAAVRQAYSDAERHLEEGRREMVDLVRAALAAKSGADAEPDRGEPVAVTGRAVKEREGFVFSYPEGLDAAVDAVAPAWADGLRLVRKTLQRSFPDSTAIVPPVEIDEVCLESIRAFGLPADREVAERISHGVAGIANMPPEIFRFLSGNEVQIWIREDLVHWLKAGAEVEGFSLDADGETVLFQAVRSANPDSGMSIEAALPPIPVVTEMQGDYFAAPLDQQIATLREDGHFIEGMIAAAASDALNLEMFAPQRVVALSEEQALFVVVHELVEAGLLTEVVASPDRRWFCDGIANLVAMRECDRRYGAGAGKRVFESLFPPEACQAYAAQVDLLAWPTSEKGGAAKDGGDARDAAHYYFATRILLAATEKRGESFLADWIAKIKETPWNRTNAETLLTAYRELTGEDLETRLREAGAE